MPGKCCVGKCRSMYFGIDEKFTVFIYRTDNNKCNKWIQASSNTVTNGHKIHWYM